MLTTSGFLKMKENKEKIVMVTAYDFPQAQQVEQAGVDMILVGDSLGMVVLGYNSTTEVKLADMVHHTKAVKRGAKDTFVVVDMPFMSYHVSVEQGIENATKLFQETNAQAVKLEGASEDTLRIVKKLTDGGIPVVAHLGLTPQTVNVMGGYKVQGKDEKTAKQLVEDAKRMAENGAMMLVLECVPKELAKVITESIDIPTIGIGAGLDCDGQVLVYHDILKIGDHHLPKFVKNYADIHQQSITALSEYVSEVRSVQFPTDAYSFKLKDPTVLPKIY